MQNPKQDIVDVLHRLITTPFPDEQKQAINKYFTENAAFRSPIYSIAAGQQSREDALGIYQWLRVLSPNTKFKATNIIFDEESKTLTVEAKILFNMRLSPVPPQPANLLILMKLKKNDREYLIESQEYFYHPDQLTNHFFAPLSPLVSLGLSTMAYASAVGAKLAQVMGIWRVSADNNNNNNRSAPQSQTRTQQADRNRTASVDSHTSEETRVSASESEKHHDPHHAKVNGKHKKRRDASGHHNIPAHT